MCHRTKNNQNQLFRLNRCAFLRRVGSHSLSLAGCSSAAAAAAPPCHHDHPQPPRGPINLHSPSRVAFFFYFSYTPIKYLWTPIWEDLLSRAIDKITPAIPPQVKEFLIAFYLQPIPLCPLSSTIYTIALTLVCPTINKRGSQIEWAIYRQSMD